MKLKLKNSFFYSAIIFVLSLPFSEAFISVSMVLLFLSSFVGISERVSNKSIKQRSSFCFIFIFYMVYILGLSQTNDWDIALYDLQKVLPFLIVPISFLLGPQLKSSQSRFVQLSFASAVTLSCIITWIDFYSTSGHSILNAQEFGFIHHIRFSLLINLALFILGNYFWENRRNLPLRSKTSMLSGIVILLLFLIWHQSLTGIVSLLATLFLLSVAILIRLKNKTRKVVLLLILFITSLIPSVFIAQSVHRYYQFDEIIIDELPTHTQSGNKYKHNFDEQSVENGHYVWLFLCESEMEAAWNKRSAIKYSDLGTNGYHIKYTLIRYLTSKDLPKDEIGVNALSEEDILHIQNGISNYILATRTLSLYPRIYVSIWELDNYFRTGNANEKSIALRIEYMKAAYSIIADNLWFGVGTGNWKTAYHNYYIDSESIMDQKWFKNAHDQYLNFMVKFGVSGLLAILFSIFYPFIKKRSYVNLVFSLFMVMIFISNFADANLETHVGSFFFSFFYSFYYFQNEK